MSRVASKAPSSFAAVSSAFGLLRVQSASSFSSKMQLPILAIRSFNEIPESARRPRKTLEAPVLLVRGMPWERHTEEDIKSLFGPFELSKVSILTDPATQKPTGHIFVEFPSVEEAQRALRHTRNVIVDERNVFVRPSTLEERQQAVDDHKKPSLVVQVRRIPYSASEAEIKALFEDIKIVGMTVGNGVAHIRVASREDFDNALKKTGTEFARKKILVISGSDFDYRLAESKPPRFVRVRGAPNTATEEDFRSFFKDLEIRSVAFTTREGISGRQTPGDVFIEFANAEDVDKALQLDRQNLGERYLQVYKSSYKEKKARLLQQEEQRQQSTAGSGEEEESRL